MNVDELSRVVAKIRLGDNRETSREVLLEWFDNIGDLDYADAIEAVRMHRRESTEYLVAAHVRAGVKRIRQARNPDNDTTPEPYRELAEGKRQSAPMPKNMKAMSAAWNDPVRWAAEVAKYDEQLIAAGFPPVGPRIGATWQPGQFRQERRAA